MNLYSKREQLNGNKDNASEIENIVLSRLANFLKTARKSDAVPIFISDGGPGYLSSRFTDISARIRFMRMFKECINDADDQQILTNGLTKENDPLRYGNNLDLDRSGLIYTKNPMEKEMNILGIESLSGFKRLKKYSDFNSEIKFEDWVCDATQPIEKTIYSVSEEFNVVDVSCFVPLYTKYDEPHLIEFVYSLENERFNGKIECTRARRAISHLVPRNYIRFFANMRKLKTLKMNSNSNSVRWCELINDIPRGVINKSKTLFLNSYDENIVSEMAMETELPRDADGNLGFSFKGLDFIESTVNASYHKSIGTNFRKLARLLSQSAPSEAQESLISNSLAYEW